MTARKIPTFLARPARGGQHMFVLDGRTFAPGSYERSPPCPGSFWSARNSSPVVQEALSNGAGGYVVKSAGGELLPAVKAVP